MLNLYQSKDIIWKVDKEDALRAYHSEDLKRPVTWAPQPGSQQAFLSCPVREVLFEGNRGPGKSQNNDSLVLGKFGWVRMGDLKVGDFVRTPKGHLAPVTHIFEFDSKPIYKVTFTDGSSTEACNEHIWKYKVVGRPRKNPNGNWNWNDTDAMVKELNKGLSVLIPTVDPLPLPGHPRSTYPIDSYLLGLLLGDGSFGKSTKYTTVDEPLKAYVKKFGFKQTRETKEFWLPKTENELFYKGLKKLKIEKTKANNKFIPNQYKIAPIEKRLAILQGLMDTDGTCDTKGYCSFTSVSEQLAKDVQEIVWSLGGKATLTGPHPSNCNGDRKQDHYDVYIQPAGKFVPFRLKRKIDRIQPYMHKDLCRRLESVEFVGSKPARCIMINDEDHLYITDDYIVTHNTDALLMDFAQHVGRGYGEVWVGVLFRRTVPELKDVIRKSKRWFREIFPDAEFNKSSRTWTFRDGEQLIFSFASVVDDYESHHGSEYPWLAWEELTTWPDDVMFKKMMSLNRCSVKGVPLKIRATTNPSGVGHNWVKRRYGLPALPGEIATALIKPEGENARISIKGRLDENKILLHADPNYKQTIRSACDTPEQEAAWLDGSWDVVSGGMFDDVWAPDVHVLRNFPMKDIPSGWKIDRSYDHGQSKPHSIGFWAQSNGEPMMLPCGRVIGEVRGDLIRIDEIYGCHKTKINTGLNLTAKEIAEDIKERVVYLGLSGRVRPGPADSSIFDRTEANKTVAGDMKKCGVKWTAADKGKGTRKHGWTQMRTLFKQAKPKKTSDGHYIREDPGLFVTDRCVDFIRTIPVLSRDKHDHDDVDTNTEDHIADEARYRCRAKLAKRTRITKG